MVNNIAAQGLDIREDGFYFLTTLENAIPENRIYDVEIRVDSGYKVCECFREIRFQGTRVFDQTIVTLHLLLLNRSFWWRGLSS